MYYIGLQKHYEILLKELCYHSNMEFQLDYGHKVWNFDLPISPLQLGRLRASKEDLERFVGQYSLCTYMSTLFHTLFHSLPPYTHTSHLHRALSLEPSLSDAYWQRHMLFLLQCDEQVHTQCLCLLAPTTHCTAHTHTHTHTHTHKYIHKYVFQSRCYNVARFCSSLFCKFEAAEDKSCYYVGSKQYHMTYTAFDPAIPEHLSPSRLLVSPTFQGETSTVANGTLSCAV